MMKKSLIFKLLPVALLSLNSTSVLAHSGHLSNATVHGLLHAEHIIALVAAGIIAYLAFAFRGK
jgi:hypothetical protein